MNKANVLIAQQLRGLHFGANWTGANLRDKLEGVSWQQATTRVGELHSIATLLFHMNYYIGATIRVMRGGDLDAKDEFSFDGPEVSTEEEWSQLLGKTWNDAEELASLIESMPEEQLSEFFVEEKNGTYWRCLLGPIEHCYYHMGQIALIKSLLKDGPIDTNP